MSVARSRSKKSDDASGKKPAKSPARKKAASGSLVKAKLGGMGPAWMSKNYWSEEEKPTLVTVILSRRVDNGILPIFLLVDRSCLGVKGAFAAEPVAEDCVDWESGVDASEMALVPCELLEAQSVVFHAIDYARHLGFEPTKELDLSLLGERPVSLLDTKWSHPTRPVYVSGAQDDVAGVLSRLNASVGVGNYDFVVGAPFRAVRVMDNAEDSVEDLF